MKRSLLLVLTAVIVLALVGCANPEELAAQQVVVDSEQAAQNALLGRGSADALKPYFATPLESGNTDPDVARRIAYVAFLQLSSPGLVHFSNFTINSSTVFSQVDEARVMYSIDVTITRRSIPQTETVSQSVLLTKTPSRGWRIAGSDAMETTTGDVDFLGNLSQ